MTTAVSSSSADDRLADQGSRPTPSPSGAADTSASYSIQRNQKEQESHFEITWVVDEAKAVGPSEDSNPKPLDAEDDPHASSDVGSARTHGKIGFTADEAWVGHNNYLPSPKRQQLLHVAVGEGGDGSGQGQSESPAGSPNSADDSVPPWVAMHAISPRSGKKPPISRLSAVAEAVVEADEVQDALRKIREQLHGGSHMSPSNFPGEVPSDIHVGPADDDVPEVAEDEDPDPSYLRRRVSVGRLLMGGVETRRRTVANPFSGGGGGRTLSVSGPLMTFTDDDSPSTSSMPLPAKRLSWTDSSARRPMVVGPDDEEESVPGPDEVFEALRKLREQLHGGGRPGPPSSSDEEDNADDNGSGHGPQIIWEKA